MQQLERNQQILSRYIPENAVPIIAQWIYDYDFKLRVKKSRSTKYGDYQSPINGKNHLITVNYNLNKYAFLVTLVHEVAHLTNFNENKNRVKPHGKEWKLHYKKLMQPFLVNNVFPEELVLQLKRYLNNPSASSCSDIDLLRVLKKYDSTSSLIFIEDLPAGQNFEFGKEKRVFIKGDKLRTRYKCKELSTRHEYYFNPLTEVRALD